MLRPATLAESQALTVETYPSNGSCRVAGILCDTVPQRTHVLECNPTKPSIDVFGDDPTMLDEAQSERCSVIGIIRRAPLRQHLRGAFKQLCPRTHIVEHGEAAATINVCSDFRSTPRLVRTPDFVTTEQSDHRAAIAVVLMNGCHRTIPPVEPILNMLQLLSPVNQKENAAARGRGVDS
jgi:hypothetical protein